MAMTRQSIKKDSIIMRTIEELVPQEHHCAAGNVHDSVSFLKIYIVILVDQA